MLDMQKLEEEAEDDLDKRYGKYRSQNASALKSLTDATHCFFILK